jgi:hypothetical protein
LTTSKDFSGNEKRFNGIVPFEENLFGRKVILSRHIRWRQLIYFIQANKITCSIHLASDNILGRATLVALEGRGMACVFGRRGKGTVNGSQAYAELLMAIKETDCTFNLTLLDPAVAYGLAAMLYGEKGSKTMESPRIAFLGCLEDMKDNGKAGCVQMVNKEGEIIVTAFVFGGKTHSYVSSRNDVNCARTAGIALQKSPGAQCRWWCLDEAKISYEMMFDLTGLENIANLTCFQPEEQQAFLDSEIVEIRKQYDSTEAFLEQFFKKPLLRDTFLFDNLSSKEQQELDCKLAHENVLRRSINNFSHYINPFWEGAN